MSLRGEDFRHLVNVLENPNMIPEQPGVYKGYGATGKNNIQLLYVGEASNLRDRVVRHDITDAVYFAVKIVVDEGERKSLERELIKRLDPIENVSHKSGGLREIDWNI